MRLRAGLLALAAGLLAAAPLRAAGLRPAPLVSVLGTCSALTSNIYPADSINWFDPARHSQVVFYAHLLFPLQSEEPDWAPGAWHPPLVLSPSAKAMGELPVRDEHFAEAEWLDPAGERIAYYSLTFPARIRADWLDLQGRSYIPHTLAMAIGTRDLRGDAGQTRLPGREGQYTVQLRVDGRPTGLAFFRMLRGQGGEAQPPAQAPALVSPTAR
jgi:hypothetical protein